MSRRPRRMLSHLMLAVAFGLIGVAAIGVAPVLAAQSASHRGDHVRRAWPAKGTQRPKTAITRWLARQVGPAKPVRCSKRSATARARCAARRRGASASASTSVALRTFAARAGLKVSHTEKTMLRPSAERRPLQLIRSFDIPADDPSYERLLNWSWTYDSAVAATAFTTAELQDQAGRLLDQLAALQLKNGAIELAFNVQTGESSASVRAGSLAFAVIAFNDYDATFGSTLYLDNARRAAEYLLSLRTDDGLVRGGPDVKWVSTQHNILTVIALTGLAEQLEKQGDEGAAASYREATDIIAKGIDSQLIVRGDELTHFRQGVGDDVVPLDVQTLGVIYALFRGDQDLAKQVYEYARQNFAVEGGSIELSKVKRSYNMTYEAKGPFSGYRPYLGKGTPNVIWFEGTAEMRFVSSFLGQPTEELDASMNSWWNVTRKQGLAPLGANRTITNNRFNEYHVWPTAAAGAWTVLSGAASDTDWANPTLGEVARRRGER